MLIHALLISAVTHEVFSKKSVKPTNGALAPATAAQLARALQARATRNTRQANRIEKPSLTTVASSTRLSIDGEI